MRLILALFLSLIWSSSVFSANRIAIFDYDARTKESPGVGPYIEEKIKQWQPSAEVKYLSANGDNNTASLMLADIEKQKWDLVITITTDAMLLAWHKLKTTPFIFTNTNNPKVFTIENKGGPDRNFSGATYYVPIKRQLQLFQRIQPGLKSIGFIFDANNRSMKAEAREARQACVDLGLGFRYFRIRDKSDLTKAATHLIRTGVEAIVATSSGEIYQNIQHIHKSAPSTPIYSFNAKGVNKGAVAALSTDYWTMVDELVMPRVIAYFDKNIPLYQQEIGYPRNPKVKLNHDMIEYHGLETPQTPDS